MLEKMNKEIQELIKYIEEILSKSKDDDYEEEDITVLIETLSESLNTAVDVINSLKEAIDELVKENKFLADTIVNANYGKITVERRKLLEEQKQWMENRRKSKNADPYLKVRLRQKMGSYHESSYDALALIAHVEDAIERARALDKNPNDRWPQTLGTRVYLLAESVMNRN